MSRADRLLKRHIRTRYLVTLATGEAFDGVLIDADERHIVLADVESVAPNGDRLTVDGHLWLPRPGVAYMQLPRI